MRFGPGYESNQLTLSIVYTYRNVVSQEAGQVGLKCPSGTLAGTQMPYSAYSSATPTLLGESLRIRGLWKECHVFQDAGNSSQCFEDRLCSTLDTLARWLIELRKPGADAQ